jgi:hypothetical protein
MRLWTIHPRHLDARGLVALWREALLAQKVLRGQTHGYRHHPQLARFKAHPRPLAAIAAYLRAVHHEAVRRDYHFDHRKIGARATRTRIVETRGQLLYEWRHLRRKLQHRDLPASVRARRIKTPQPHPLFRLVPGPVRDWERAR